MKRILVCGGRDICNERLIQRALDSARFLAGNFILIHGGARGADSLAARWAKQNGIETRVFKPQWGAYGKTAGPIRNQQMLDEGKPDMVIAFPGNVGTADMVRRANKAGLPIFRIGWTESERHEN